MGGDHPRGRYAGVVRTGYAVWIDDSDNEVSERLPISFTTEADDYTITLRIIEPGSLNFAFIHNGHYLAIGTAEGVLAKVPGPRFEVAEDQSTLVLSMD